MWCFLAKHLTTIASSLALGSKSRQNLTNLVLRTPMLLQTLKSHLILVLLSQSCTIGVLQSRMGKAPLNLLCFFTASARASVLAFLLSEIAHPFLKSTWRSRSLWERPRPQADEPNGCTSTFGKLLSSTFSMTCWISALFCSSSSEISISFTSSTSRDSRSWVFKNTFEPLSEPGFPNSDSLSIGKWFEGSRCCLSGKNGHFKCKDKFWHCHNLKHIGIIWTSTK